ncbi:MAG: hypothetical protein SGPRY_010246, partial [Prymnesium sp.]
DCTMTKELSADKFAMLESRMSGAGSSPGFVAIPRTQTSIGFGHLAKRGFMYSEAIEQQLGGEESGQTGEQQKTKLVRSPSLTRAEPARNKKARNAASKNASQADAARAGNGAAELAIDSTANTPGQCGKSIQRYFPPDPCVNRLPSSRASPPNFHPSRSSPPSTAKTAERYIAGQFTAARSSPSLDKPAEEAGKCILTDLQNQLAEAMQQRETAMQEKAEAMQRREEVERQLSQAVETQREELARARSERDSHLSQLKSMGAELEEARAEAEALLAANTGMKDELRQLRAEQQLEEARQARGREALRAALREQCFRTRAEARERLARESVRLGRVEPESSPFSTTWVQKDGAAMAAIKERERNIDTRKQALEETKKILKKRKTGKSAVALGASLGCEDAMDTYDSLDAEEALKLRGALLAKEAAEVATERKGLEREAQMHYLELKLVQEFNELDEELRDCPSLPHHDMVHEPGAIVGSAARSQERFVFLDLIATGGFSAVFKAYDMLKHEYVACKLHHVSKEWSDQRKEAFVRHVEREIDITVGVQHRRIVETFAAFEINDSTFVSVMPFCNGGSLAELLRRHGPLTEKDARSIIVQAR